MTRPTGEDEMSSEHAEVLERLRGVLEHGKMGDKCLIAPDLVIAAIAALSAPQPASDGGFTAADMMDARQERRKEAQQPATWQQQFADKCNAFRVGQAVRTPWGEGIVERIDPNWNGGGVCVRHDKGTTWFDPGNVQPAAVDGAKCPWDGGSPCVEPMPAGMVYPKKPAPRAGGYLDTSGVEWNAWDAGQMEAYARAAYSDGWEAGYRAALAQQPAADGGFTAADMMDARQEGRKEAQQSAAVDGALRAEVAAVWNAMPSGTRYLDPPDGGDVPLHEQVRRMAADAARAERLAEALQKLAAHIRPTCSVLWDEAQAALRDHDQEGDQ